MFEKKNNWRGEVHLEVCSLGTRHDWSMELPCGVVKTAFSIQGVKANSTLEVTLEGVADTEDDKSSAGNVLKVPFLSFWLLLTFPVPHKRGSKCCRSPSKTCWWGISGRCLIWGRNIKKGLLEKQLWSVITVGSIAGPRALGCNSWLPTPWSADCLVQEAGGQAE